MTIISCMVPEISSVTDRIFSHFMLFFALLPPNNPENQNFEKMKKIPGDITILHYYHFTITIGDSTMNQNHLMYDS